jgi:hypothetical protein
MQPKAPLKGVWFRPAYRTFFCTILVASSAWIALPSLIAWTAAARSRGELY